MPKKGKTAPTGAGGPTGSTRGTVVTDPNGGQRAPSTLGSTTTRPITGLYLKNDAGTWTNVTAMVRTGTRFPTSTVWQYYMGRNIGPWTPPQEI